MKRLLLLPVFFAPLLLCAQETGTFTRKEIKKLPESELLFSARRDSFEYFTVEDTLLSLYRLPPAFNKPERWQKRETANLTGEFYGAPYSESLALEDVLAIIDGQKEFWRLCSAKSWCLNHYEQAFPHLVARLSVKQKVGLENTADLIIWDRIGTGDLQFYGHGGGVNEDLFTVAGRASWILNEITGEHFAVVHGNLTREQAQGFKKLWVDYISRLTDF